MVGVELVAMTTSATIVMVLMIVATAAVVMATAAVVMSTTAVIMVATTSAAVTMTAATTCQVLHHVVNLFLAGLTILQHGAFEIECLASQRMVEVHLYFLFANLQHATIETLALLILQGYDSVLIDVLVVEVTINAEHIAVEIEDILLVILAIALFLAQSQIEVLALLCGNHLLLELIEGETKAGDE